MAKHLHDVLGGGEVAVSHEECVEELDAEEAHVNQSIQQLVHSSISEHKLSLKLPKMKHQPQIPFKKGEMPSRKGD